MTTCRAAPAMTCSRAVSRRGILAQTGFLRQSPPALIHRPQRFGANAGRQRSGPAHGPHVFHHGADARRHVAGNAKHPRPGNIGRMAHPCQQKRQQRMGEPHHRDLHRPVRWKSHSHLPGAPIQLLRPKAVFSTRALKLLTPDATSVFKITDPPLRNAEISTTVPGFN